MNGFQILRCSSTERESALKCLHAGLSPDQQTAFIQTLDLLRGSDASLFDGLLVAKSDDKLIAATWVQFTPGSAAIVWPPAFDSPAANELMVAIDRLLDEQKIALAQIVIAANEFVDENLLAVGGFRQLVDLAYLTLERSNFPRYLAKSALEFEPRATDHTQRLQATIKHSYAGTLDCPELNDLRDPAEVVAGYQVQGTFNPENWFLVRSADQDVGLLILAEHPPGENWELVYMGIVPTARGQGFGEQVVRFAAEQARKNGAERLVLAVDERNSPALDMYRRLGFVMWERRIVYARLRGRET
ncbi:MAG: GNAT family N-acetyltransferase [Bythopirellula sp.]|nr:GNAT family N-acetyltransferase [Bythopirellula sp.]